MTGMEFRSDMGVELIDHMGTDESVVRSARVSLLADELDAGDTEIRGLIGYLMKQRHGTPFEACVATVRVEVPIFVARELVRHRIASFNESSGRYAEMRPVFWVPAADRPLTQTGPSARPTMGVDEDQERKWMQVTLSTRRAAEGAWELYQLMLETGIPKEVARVVLPVSTYTRLYCTMNMRGWMNFLSLRTYVDGVSAVRSYPQQEIEQLATRIEQKLRAKFPVILQAFDDNGRIAP